MLVDVFLFNGETDMAALRVATLREHVGRMVAVSCNLTHQSDPADPVPPPDGCEWVTVHADPIPEGRGGEGTPYYQWIERQHRDGAVTACLDLEADDVVMVSDVDEIPDPLTLHQMTGPQGPRAVPMRMHGFAVDYLYPLTWIGTTVSTAAEMAPQAHRSWRHRLPKVGGGWHLSWFGDLDEKRRKLRSFSHAELADLDVDRCTLTGTHANGERMRRLTRDEVLGLDWPAPLFDDIPASWWAPEV